MLKALLSFFDGEKSLTLAVALVIGLAAGWTTNGCRLNEKILRIERDAAQAARQAEIDARAVETRWNQSYQNALKERDETLQHFEILLDSARADADRLRGDADQLRGALSSAAAARERIAAAALDVSGACADEYRWMAGEAARCVADRDALIAAWPKNEH
ncbi:MAG: hypothetical protein LBD67_05335 [Candidatus Accumulibacter sp.]|jgi:hypothetical protein|nr:hypothetical protein [Accumulibacter sp.]